MGRSFGKTQTEPFTVQRAGPASSIGWDCALWSYSGIAVAVALAEDIIYADGAGASRYTARLSRQKVRPADES
jgi:hypothetical protein